LVTSSTHTDDAIAAGLSRTSNTAACPAGGYFGMGSCAGYAFADFAHLTIALVAFNPGAL
jgi:hypothetical protein